MKKSVFLLMLSNIFIPLSILGQTAKENLENGIEIYNSIKAYTKDINDMNITSENIAEVKRRSEKATKLFDKVKADGSDEQIRAARYYKMNAQYKVAFTYAQAKNNATCLKLLKEVESEMNSFTESSFPIRYAYFDKNYKIEFEKNFSSIQGEFYSLIADMYNYAGERTKALEYYQKSINIPNTPTWNKFVAYVKLTKDKDKNNEYDRDMLNYALATMEQYDNLGEESKKLCTDRSFETYYDGALAFEKALAVTSKFSERGDMSLKAARIATKYTTEQNEAKENRRADNLKNAQNWFKDAIENGKDDKATLTEGLTFAKEKQGKDSDLGKFIVDKLADKVAASDCEGFKKIGEDYTFFGMASKADAMNKKGAKCQKDKDNEAARQAEARRKEEEAMRRRQYKLDHPFNVFIAFDVTPLLQNINNLGGHVDFRFKKSALSFGYTQFVEKKDLNSKNVKWEGYKAFAAIKYFQNKYSGSYSGFHVGYADKTFIPIETDVTTTTGTSPVTKRMTLTPLDKQYEAMILFGGQLLGRGLGIDFYFGVGGSYNQLSYKEQPTLDFEKTTFAGSEFYEARQKKESFNVKMRLGMTIGLNLGGKR
jgi:tetratricopeptide (TPR) repeat protein